MRLSDLMRRVFVSPLGLLGAMALIGFLAAAAVTWVRGLPALPAVHDEASLLLASDTFARGRLTNPPAPFPEHFESYHTLVRPTYASKYPPAQGLVLAIGQVLTGEPIVGVWLSTALLAAAFTWMLLGWVPRNWAVFGSALVLLMLAGAGYSYWLSTYWGGTVAATGAALAYGSVRRLTQTPSARYAVLLALGLGTLALSRPFEGALAAVPVLVVSGLWSLRDRAQTLAWRFRRVFLPFALTFSAIAAFALLHNQRVTGNALRAPYAEYEAQYSAVPLFLLGSSKRPNVSYANAEMRAFYREQGTLRREKTSSRAALVKTLLERVAEMKSLLAPGLTLVFMIAAATSRIRRTLVVPFLGTALVLGGSLATSWFFPHYIAPALAPWAIVLTAGAERLWTVEARPGRTGPLITSCIFALTALTALVSTWRLSEQRPTRQASWVVRRDSLERAIKSDGTTSKHIVLVRYGAAHDPDNEWVHNAADLSRSTVLWARSLSPQQDARLLTHFRDRAAWRVQVDSGGAIESAIRVTNSSPDELAKQ